MSSLSKETIKCRLGEKAATLISSGMKIGLGTGTTTAYFIKALAERCKKETLDIRATASSKASWNLGASLGIPLHDIDTLGLLDITIDGADEIDPLKRMIKGGGGAHTREKIVAAASQELVILVDESKLVHRLGKTKLPIEVGSFAKETTKRHLEKIHPKTRWRLDEKGNFFITDGGNFILDMYFSSPLDNPETLEKTLRSIPGVIDTGFFFHLTGRVLVGFSDGQIIVRN